MLDHVGNALEARHASEMQVRQFVADASHELRTPLAAIRGYAELSRRSRQPVPEESRTCCAGSSPRRKRMTALVEDLLLLARLDAGRPLAHDPVDLTMLVVDAVSDAHAAGPRHDWQLDLPDEPVAVIGDGARLHQVLANLLANARTHTPEGTDRDGRGRRRAGRRGAAGDRRRPGHPGRAAAAHLRAVRPRRQLPLAGGRQHRPGPVHRARGGHRARRHGVGATARPGQTVFTVRLPLAADVPGGRMPSISTSRGVRPVAPGPRRRR